jgi:hypothetical protein
MWMIHTVFRTAFSQRPLMLPKVCTGGATHLSAAEEGRRGGCACGPSPAKASLAPVRKLKTIASIHSD